MGPVAVAQALLQDPMEEWSPDRDQDMALAEAALAAMACMEPRPYSMVMNFVSADGDLLFAGEWSGQASQVTYYVPVDAVETQSNKDTPAEQELAAPLQAEQEPVVQPEYDPLVLLDLVERLDDPKVALLAYMIQGENRTELAVTDFSHPEQSFFPLIRGDGIPIQPKWSPDGQRIFFYYLSNPAMNVVSLWVVDLVQRDMRNLNDDSQAANAQFSWSPDGVHIAYPGRQPYGMTVDILRTDAAGDETLNLTNSASADTAPDWSPDGAHIVFASDRDAPGVDALWVMAAEGTDPRRLTDAAPLLDGLPTWSPDGAEIAFFLRGTDPTCTQANGLWAIRPDGSEERLIAESTGLSMLEPVDRRWPPLESPVWSPDGAWSLLSN